MVGLAWTQFGGDILIIEAVTMRGKGNIILTGNLGEVMQESARAALSYLKSHSDELNIKDVKWDEIDIHVHVPEGAIPKDGPSAGVALATVLYSVVSGKRIRNDVAITGETTLRGMVLPVGGIREKILAAKRYGIKEVLLPEGNKVDVEEMPQWAIKGLKITFIGEVSEAINKCVSDNGK
jgi:ATP-dependent Lon protease